MKCLMMINSDVCVVIGDVECDDVFGVCKVVFVDEQGVDEELEWDEYDDFDVEVVYFVVFCDGDVVGVV